jgi:processing peptidase subunit alpha
VREIEAIGGIAKASASREMMSYTYGALKTYMPEMVEVLIDCVRNPAFLDWEVKEQVFHLISSPSTSVIQNSRLMYYVLS